MSGKAYVLRQGATYFAWPQARRSQPGLTASHVVAFRRLTDATSFCKLVADMRVRAHDSTVKVTPAEDSRGLRRPRKQPVVEAIDLESDFLCRLLSNGLCLDLVNEVEGETMHATTFHAPALDMRAYVHTLEKVFRDM